MVLLSGGMDSATCLGLALREEDEVWTVSFDYGQRHAIELAAAHAVAAHWGIAPERRLVVPLDHVFSGSALTGHADVPLARSQGEIGQDVPITYVPARNLVFLSIATALAEPLDVQALFIGANALDYSGYPDCRPAFLDAFARTAQLGTRSGIEGSGLVVRAPLLQMRKREIVLLGHELGVPFALTHSCYLGLRPACGQCDACQLRRKGFAEAGLTDPLPYASNA